jgi:uncharacterized integral membrane protein (TIGR00698 family)
MTATMDSIATTAAAAAVPNPGAVAAVSTPIPPPPANWYEGLDSFEGVPDLDVFSPRKTPDQQGVIGRKGHQALNWLGVVAPGVLMAFALAYLGYVLSIVIGHLMSYDKSPISPIMVAVVLGLLVRNTVGVPKAYEPGLRLCLKTVLRLGIVLLGLGLGVQAVAKTGLVGIPIIVCCIATALIAVTFINRALGLPKRLGTLIAVGTSICGVSAIVATAPVIEAEDDETSYAVACITIFGLLALFTYPLFAHWMFSGNNAQVGTFLGTAIHDTSQVAGAGLAYSQQFRAKEAMDTAIVVKLVRNVSMGLLIPLMALLYRRSAGDGSRRVKQPWHQVVPLFVIGFVAMACVRSIGDIDTARAFGVLDRSAWHHLIDDAAWAAPWLLATAMAAVGLGTGLAKLRGLGWKPFSVGLAAALMVGGVSVALVKLLGPLIHQAGS